MSLLIKSTTAAVLAVTTLLFGNASAAPLGPLAPRDALTPTAQLVRWGGGFDSGGYGDVSGFGDGGYSGYGGGYGNVGHVGYSGYGGGYGNGGYGSGGYGDVGGFGGYGATAARMAGMATGRIIRPITTPQHVYRGHRDASKKDRGSQSAAR